ncbi:MAG: 1-(5-phosphoribosyl)-5-[(5-phosphoribosylamino)methylideneamino]imidazole-4-carboxamide isomerase [Candidatus Omnitrophica bacterium]|nr:1-(5-phosphoribosyl)-5-[(5-phosphoribosylamino)methylideneamino]imidazole-4-carboxamide isomerase [Candidatus Omnitrophota bacterium]
MVIIPAIDLYQGNVVRLRRGDPAQSKVYNSDPVAAAKDWESQGAQLLHLVDLSAAFEQADNLSIIKDILSAVKVKVQVGGGIRDSRKAGQLISLGAERVIVGTRSIEENFLDELIKSIGPEKLAVGVDVIDNCLAVKGWKEKTELNAYEFISKLSDKGIRWIVYTDISRDGMLSGIDFEQYNQLSRFSQLKIIASGGVSNLDDVRQLKIKVPFIWGVISGKALYEGMLDLKQASQI